ncbi:general transcription factor II-I repeat domain-containing protein 2 [Trichonephila clavipes]|nr:general transcription factor II-I repeat domain-containing protein 2 [Trichonephila clavipes]
MVERKIERKKRKLEDENRQFQNEWEKICTFFIHVKDKAVCLICRHSISILKSYNLKRHHEQKHGEIDKLTVSERKAKLQSLKNNLTSQQYIFHKQTAQPNGIVSVSFQVYNISAKYMKPFTDGNYIKDCLIAVVEEICPEKLDLFTQISLSLQTVERRIENISREICASLNTITTSFVYFSLALDETSDINDTAQFAIFIRDVDSQMNIIEELLELVSLKGTTTGRDIKDAVINCAQSRQIRYEKSCRHCNRWNPFNAVGSLVVTASDSRPERLGSMPPNILRVHTEYVLVKSMGPKSCGLSHERRNWRIFHSPSVHAEIVEVETGDVAIVKSVDPKVLWVVAAETTSARDWRIVPFPSAPGLNCEGGGRWCRHLS